MYLVESVYQDAHLYGAVVKIGYFGSAAQFVKSLLGHCTLHTQRWVLEFIQNVANVE